MTAQNVKRTCVLSFPYIITWISLANVLYNYLDIIGKRIV